MTLQGNIPPHSNHTQLTQLLSPSINKYRSENRTGCPKKKCHYRPFFVSGTAQRLFAKTENKKRTYLRPRDATPGTSRRVVLLRLRTHHQRQAGNNALLHPNHQARGAKLRGVLIIPLPPLFSQRLPVCSRPPLLSPNINLERQTESEERVRRARPQTELGPSRRNCAFEFLLVLFNLLEQSHLTKFNIKFQIKISKKKPLKKCV